MRRKIESFKRKFKFIPAWTPAVLGLLVASLAMYGFGRSLDIATVRDEDGRQQMLLTASKDPDVILVQAGFSTGQNDQVSYLENETGVDVYIHRSFPASLAVDGKVIEDEFREGTVADMLYDAGVQLGEHDYTQPSLDTPLTQNMAVTVYRVKYVEEHRRETLPQEVVDAYIQSLPPGTEFQLSTNGTVYDVLYRDRLEDGLLVDSEVVQLTAVIEAPAPRAADSFAFNNEGIPHSRIAGYDDIEFGTDGLPLHYTRVMENAIATAYSSSRGRGSSGLGLYCGTAAVNPNVIPYGTRMWVTSADGKFVYGFCVATDTGTAMMEGRVDIDLFFETNAECLRFGKRPVNVYILDGNVKNLDKESVIMAAPAQES